MSYIIGTICCAALVFADQFTKYLAVEHLGPGGKHGFIDGFLGFLYHENRGAAFGLFQGGRWIFVTLTVIVLAAVVYFYIKLPKTKSAHFARASLVMITAGALGNGIDRARQGFVVDFLNFEFIDFPIFNIADMCVVGGTIFFTIWAVFFYKEEPKKVKTE
jgi:signal peptidase II